MVFKSQERDDYEDYDPVPYQGGYDQAVRYGSLKPADKECGYRRSQLAEEKPVAQYGNERNPYSRGHPGPSVYGGVSKPGAVYGGGRDRTEPSTDKAQSGKGVKTGSGRRTPANDKQQEQSYTKPDHSQEDVKSSCTKPKPDHSQEDVKSSCTKPRAAYDYEVSEESGYRKLKSIYDAEEQSNPTYGEGETGYRHSYYGYDEAKSGNLQKPLPTYSEVDQYGYRRLFYGYGEADSGCRDFLYGYGDGEAGSSNPQPTSNEEDSVYRKPFNQVESRPGPIYGGQATSYDRSASDEGAYGSYGYGYRPNYGEETSGYGGQWKQFDDDDPARFGGGSAFVEEPIRNAPKPAPANRSWW